MYFDFKVKIPEGKGKIYERTIKGVVYINYEYDRVYKLDRKYNIAFAFLVTKKVIKNANIYLESIEFESKL